MFLLGGLGFTSLLVSESVPIAVVLANDGQNGVLHDTYYVQANFNSLLLQLTVILVLASIAWLQERSGAMRHPRITRWLFWPLYASLAALNSTDLVMMYLMPGPIRYIDYAEGFTLYSRFSIVCAFIALMAASGILALATWSGFARWRFGKV